MTKQEYTVETFVAAQDCALTHFTASNLEGKEVTADVQFVEALNRINGYAIANDVILYITDSFREATL